MKCLAGLLIGMRRQCQQSGLDSIKIKITLYIIVQCGRAASLVVRAAVVNVAPLGGVLAALLPSGHTVHVANVVENSVCKVPDNTVYITLYALVPTLTLEAFEMTRFINLILLPILFHLSCLLHLAYPH